MDMQDKLKEALSDKAVSELHVHLGGSVPLYRLWELATERGIRGHGIGYDHFIESLRIKDSKVYSLESYLEVYDTVELIQSGPASVKECVRIAAQGIYRTSGMEQLGPGGEGGASRELFRVRNLELRLNPLKRTGAVFLKGSHAGLYDVDRIIKGLCDVVDEIHMAFKDNFKLGLIFCFGRDMTFQANKILAEKTAKWAALSPNIIGIDLAGSEKSNPLSDDNELKQMKSLYDILPSNLGRTVHVGETPHVSLDTFVKTIDALQPHRVAHPIVAFRDYFNKKDDRGLRILKERGIAIEFCVKSNLLTKAVESLSDYKRVIATCNKFAIPYTFSTDAPALQLNTLAYELLLLIKNDLCSIDDILYAVDCADKHKFIKVG